MQINLAESRNDQATLIRHLRNRALVLVGFWRGFRSDELSRLEIKNVSIIPGEGMTLFLPFSKTDRDHQGQTYKAPVLSRLCPVTAYQQWIDASHLTTGPVFPAINCWGHIGRKAMHPTSFIQLLRELFRKADIAEPDSYSSHSLRRGFASWAGANGWDLKTLMKYVGWKDVRSAMRYIDTPDPFLQNRINQDLNSLTHKSITTRPTEQSD